MMSENKFIDYVKNLISKYNIWSYNNEIDNEILNSMYNFNVEITSYPSSSFYYDNLNNQLSFHLSATIPQKEAEDFLEYISKHYVYRKYKNLIDIKNILE
jgi:hypothetical protein